MSGDTGRLCGWQLLVDGLLHTGLRCALEAGHDASMPHDVYPVDALRDLDGDRREQLLERLTLLLLAADDEGDSRHPRIRERAARVATGRAAEILVLLDPLLVQLADYEAEAVGL